MMRTMQRAGRPALAIAMLVGLAACMGTSGLGSRARTGAAPQADAARKSATQAGRERLAGGMPGAAVGFFQVALATGEPAAPAFNGLAVAYARLGRQDLALRYFRMAAQLDPANTVFAANLRIASEAVAEIDARAARLAAERAAERLAASRAVPEPTPAGLIERTSAREVRIATLPSQPAPVARIAGVRVVTARADVPVPVPSAAEPTPSLIRVVTGIRMAGASEPLALARVAP